MRKIEPYPSQLTDAEWELVRRHFPGRGKLGRPPRYERRAVIDGIFYIVRSGCGWRDMPHDLPPWRLVYHYFAKWQREGLWQRLNDTLRDRVRVKSGKKKPPRLRPSIAKALRWLANPESAVLMRAKRSWDENDISWWTRWA